MTYAQTEIRPGEGLNTVVGPNGNLAFREIYSLYYSQCLFFPSLSLTLNRKPQSQALGSRLLCVRSASGLVATPG